MTDDTNKKDAVSRKSFLNTLITGAASALGLMILYPVFSFLKPPKQREVQVVSASAGKAADMQINDSKIIRFGNKPVIIIKKGEADYKAFSAVCTHLDCTVQYKKDEDKLWCACHNGRYDLQGKNVSGPPPRPLEKFAVNIKNGELIISKIS